MRGPLSTDDDHRQCYATESVEHRLPGALGGSVGADPSEAISQALLRTGSADGFDEEDPHGRLRVLQVGSPFWMVRDAQRTQYPTTASPSDK